MFCSLTSYAAETKTIRVGYFAFQGYHEVSQDENGLQGSGYGFDFLQLLRRYTNLNYQYIGYENGWQDMLQMLRDGEIDMVTSARKTSQREKKFAFSSPIGTSCAELSVRSDDHRFNTNDYESFDGMKIGVLKGNSRNADLDDLARERGFTYYAVEYDEEADLTEALRNGDVVRIREILVNILSNAVKFTNDGGSICFETNYRTGLDDGHIIVQYRVTDTGVGMTEEFVNRVFEEFAQEEDGARTQYKGTGLGLAITKQYVELMGGTISVESKKGCGSIFTVELPMELTDKEAVGQKGQSHMEKDLEGICVLLAEDNDLNAEIAEIQLEDFGMIITRVLNGKQAVDLFEDSPEGTFDLILMDIMMPEMNGYDATKAIRNLPHRLDGRRIPIIAMTANAFVEDVQASMDAGMNAHIAKPLVMEEVIKVISRNLQ